MKILFIKQLFNPEPTAKSLDFAIELQKRGHEVQVLTGFPSYPLGRIYDGYQQKLWKRENMKGVELIRVPIYPDHSDSGLKRMLHYLSYAVSASIIGPFVVKKPDVAFVYQGAIPVGIPAVIFKWFRGVPFVYDINDLWPESVQASGMMKNDVMLKIISKWCKFNYNNAKFISVCTPGFKKRLLGLGLHPDKVYFVPNWSRDNHRTLEISDEIKSKFSNGRMNFLYAGNLGVVQALDIILSAANALRDDHRVMFHILGEGADEKRLKQLAEKLKLINVQFYKRVDSDVVSQYLYSADVLLVHLKKTELFEITIPSKILSYLRTGKPILMGMHGDSAQILNESGAGMLFEPENVQDLVSKVKEFLNMSKDERNIMGEKGNVYYSENLSIENSTNILESLLNKAIDK